MFKMMFKNVSSVKEIENLYLLINDQLAIMEAVNRLCYDTDIQIIVVLLIIECVSNKILSQLATEDIYIYKDMIIRYI